MEDTEMPEEFEARSQSFLAWLQHNGTIISPKIELADLRQRGAGRGVLAKEDVAEDEELFSIPRSSILTVETSYLSEKVRNDIEDPWLGLIIAMLYEHQRGSESSWEPYFKVLPAEFDTLMFWSDGDLESLKGSAVVNKIGKASGDTAFKEQIFPVIKKHASIFDISSLSDDDLLALCHRMGSTIMAYAFDLEKPSADRPNGDEDGWEEDEEELESLSKGMVPLADMLNADADRNNAKLYYEEDKVVIMKSIKPIQAGDEIFNDYGPLPTADVLRRYGYTTSNYAKYDVVELSLDLIKVEAKERSRLSDQETEKRTQYLSEQDILDDVYDIAHAGNEDIERFPEELCILINTLTLPQADLDKLVKKDKLPKPELSAPSADLLIAVLRKRRAMYSAGVEANGSNDSHYDAALARMEHEVKDPSARRRVMAMRVVQGEQQVLDEALEILKYMPTAGEKRKADTESETATKKQRA